MNSNSRTDYWYDETGLSQETGARNASYLRSPSGGLLSSYSGTTLQDYFTDRLGSVTATTSPGRGLVNTYRYDPWGGNIGTSGSSYNPYMYTSTYKDSSTTFYQMGARYYQNGTGRFTQEDPRPSSVFEPNRYSYAGDDPANAKDPTGLDAWGLCYGGYGGVSLFVSYQHCYGFDTQGNVGELDNAGIGGSTPTIGGGPSVMWSNVRQWSDQNSWSASGGLAAGPVSVDASAGKSSDGSYNTYGLNVGGRDAIPNIHAQAAYTWTNTWFNAGDVWDTVTGWFTGD